MTSFAYAELDAISNFSFLRGASHPEELVSRAATLNLRALGIADDNTLAGVVRAHTAAKQTSLKVLIGTRLSFVDQTPSLLVYPINVHGYRSMSALLTTGKMRARKGRCELQREDLSTLSDVIAIALPPDTIAKDFGARLLELKAQFGDGFFCAASFLYDGLSDERIAQLMMLEQRLGVPMVVTNSVIAHDNTRRPLADVLSCIREKTTLEKGRALVRKNSERFLKPAEEMWRLFRHVPQWLERSVVIADAINFSLDQLTYHYPSMSSDQASDYALLEEATMQGARTRYGQHLPTKIRALLAEELAIVRDLNYAPYFLTVHDIVMFARARGILCQGRGSAANSAICYCLGITEVDPNANNLLFGRFISKERNEPPDIDVDFENSAREEVMQYIFAKYGRMHAAITATVITYKKRMALREVAKVFGLKTDAIDALMKAVRGISLDQLVADLATHEQTLVREVALDAGLSDQAILLQQIILMAHLLIRFPRHLGQHVGGFVINHYPLNELVPIGNAAMENRTFIEWDKDDLDAMRILKVDILALGMLSAIKRSFNLIATHFHKTLTLHMPRDDKRVYAMLSRADSLGVFQVESRAQMSMLPRLRPTRFYDLVIQVAIIRPGPIQGDMVHPYLRRRNGDEPITYPSPELKSVLERTLGVPLFQEQVMQVAIVGAGFSPGEADTLRRSMATFKRLGTVNHFKQRFIDGMIANGYSMDFAERVFGQILGFAEYGFPESHAASFANLVYVSAWLKYYYPECFAAALLNSQPMGFYAPSQILADAKRHGVTVLPIDTNKSFYETSLEPMTNHRYAIRLGFHQISGINEEECSWLIATRPERGYSSIADVYQRSSVSKKFLLRLNKAHCFASFGLDERQAEWQILGLTDNPPPLLAHINEPDAIALHFKKISPFDRVRLDYHYTGHSLKQHPIAFIRSDVARRQYVSSQDFATLTHGALVKIVGLVIIRQRPATAKGVIFFTLEDEYGLMNIVIWPNLLETRRKEVLLAPIVAIKGRLEKKDGVHHVIASDIHDMSSAFLTLKSKSRDFR